MVHEGLSLEYGATVKKHFPKPSQRPDSVPLERAKLEALQTWLPEKRANTAPDLPGLSLVWNSFGSLQSRTPCLGDTTCRIPWAQDQDRCFDCSNLLGLSPAGPATRGRVLCQWHLAVCHQQTVQISLLCGSGAGGTSLCLIELGMAGGSSYNQTANPNVGFVSTSHPQVIPLSKEQSRELFISGHFVGYTNRRWKISLQLFLCKIQTRTKGSNWG